MINQGYGIVGIIASNAQDSSQPHLPREISVKLMDAGHSVVRCLWPELAFHVRADWRKEASERSEILANGNGGHRFGWKQGCWRALSC